MNDAGNHGGASPGEVSPALTFISPKLRSLQSQRPCPAEASEAFQYYQTVEQSDIAPTLAGLLGFPVPLNNLGVFIPDFLPLWSQSKFNRLPRAVPVFTNSYSFAPATAPGRKCKADPRDCQRKVVQ
jgi:hypothetical protein